MTIEELKVMKRMPKGKSAVCVKDEATICIVKIEYTNKSGNKENIFEAKVIFTYSNGKEYELHIREKSLQKTIEKGLIKFDQRNEQMKNYRQSGVL